MRGGGWCHRIYRSDRTIISLEAIGFVSAILKKMTDLTDSSFADFVSANKFAVIHFWAIWNGYDVTMKDILERQIPAELCDLIAFARLDVDRGENPRICQQIKLRNVPSLALYRDGELF